jgi:methylenetetrahydrofolate dehydrogenase (NADP+)/methenyltetrahydrofolate cyclohydrolase
MTCKLIDGNLIAKKLREKIKRDVEIFRQSTGITPRLGAILVGDDPASHLYISKKVDACVEVGIYSGVFEIPPTKEAIYETLREANDDPEISGYILQLPLPKELDQNDFFSEIKPTKDVDVFHPENVGLLVQGKPRFKPCTPHAVQIMLHESGIQIAGKRVTIINRSNVIGKPLSSMMIQECDDYANATTTVCHDRTPPEMLKEICLQSDIVVVAVGKPGFLTFDFIKPGSAVIDVGITRQGKKVLGDVDEKVREVAGLVSPVPGGVGPVVVACLLQNTLKAARDEHEKDNSYKSTYN